MDDSIIPSGSDQGTFTLADSLVTLASDVTATAEAMRALRTYIMAQHLDKGRRALAFCAPTAGVGCTLVAANLAVGLSQIGVKTLLVDANLRYPAIDELFVPSIPREGLVQCLSSSREDFGDYIESDVLPNLSIVFAGGATPNPQELLANSRFEELINFCSREFQMTILDTPPANNCSDARRVSTVSGYSLVVSRKNKTLVKDVKTLIEQLESERAKVVGTVMTED